MNAETFFDEGTAHSVVKSDISTSTADLGPGVLGLAYTCRRDRWHIVAADWLSEKKAEILSRELEGMLAILWGLVQ